MCGIVGYTGPREAGPILIEGLARLEYRGYDSAGIALVDDGGDLFVEKKAGKLANLRAAIADRTPHAAIGLAHTRWATHGRPNDLNAHPHQDCTGDITVIHNGIIENFRELRDGLEARGHLLTSETDTEALAHLVEEATRATSPMPCAAALRQVEGAYAHRGHAPRRGRPARRGAQGRARSSSASADGESVPRQRRRGHPRPHRPGHLPRGGRRRRPPSVRRDDHRRRRRAARSARSRPSTGRPEAAEKGGYEHFMLKEIHEQPESLRQAIAGRVTREDRIWLEELEGFEETLRAGRPGRAHRLRQRVLRRARRGGRDPGLDRHPGPGDGRLGVPLQPAAASTARPSSSPSPSRARRPTRSPRPGSPASAARRSSPSPTRSAARSPARRTRSCSCRPGRRSRSPRRRRSWPRSRPWSSWPRRSPRSRGAPRARAGAGARRRAARAAGRRRPGRSRTRRTCRTWPAAT